MAQEATLPLLSNGEAGYKEWNLRSSFSTSASALLAVLLALAAVLVRYTETKATDAHVNQYYMWYIHVAIMIFVGFGYLMTFLKRYANSAVGLNFFTSCLVMLEFIIVGGVVQQMIWGGSKVIELDLPLLIDAAFCAGACMISFGAVLGRTSPTQLMWLLVLEVPLYAFNQHMVFEYFGALDIGGSISIHAFGAYYGLAASMMLPKATVASTKNGASYVSDITAMIGTIFLWIFWPSFNGAMASNPSIGDDPSLIQFQFHCVINTVVALLGACVTAFIASAAFENKFDMVHIQNASLAGGVAVGSCANLKILPAGALAIGVVAGLLSTYGYVKISPTLESRIGLQDTCGVNNLHGMPGLMGGVAALVASYVQYEANKHIIQHGAKQPLYQLMALCANLAMAVVGGLLAGFIISKLSRPVAPEVMYEDEPWWAEKEADHEG